MDIVRILGIILFMIFYGSYFFKMYTEKKRGVSVSRMALGDKPAGTRIIELFLLFITYGIAIVQALSVIFYDRWERLLVMDGSRAGEACIILAGVLIGGTGIAFFIMAMRQMEDNWRAGIDESQNTFMVTDGIYKMSRNPAFVGFDLFYIGYGILFSNGLMLLFTLLAVFTLHMQIKEEEKYMAKRYGTAYQEYRERVRRYL